jgi:hypothetical protein
VATGERGFRWRIGDDARRFPPPWTTEEQEVCFIVRDQNGQALAYVYFEEEPGRRSAAHLLTRDEAQRVAATSPSCRSCCASHRPLSTHFRYDLNSGHFAGLRSLTSLAIFDRLHCKIVALGRQHKPSDASATTSR